MQDYFYSSVAAIALVVHVIINWRELFEWRNVSVRAGAREFRHFVLCLLVFFSADFLWGVFEALKWPRVLYADTLTFFVTMALSVYMWSCFIGTYLEMGGGARRRLRWAGRGVLAFFLVALAANLFTGRFFTIDARGAYAAGPVRQLAFSLMGGELTVQSKVGAGSTFTITLRHVEAVDPSSLRAEPGGGRNAPGRRGRRRPGCSSSTIRRSTGRCSRPCWRGAGWRRWRWRGTGARRWGC